LGIFAHLQGNPRAIVTPAQAGVQFTVRQGHAKTLKSSLARRDLDFRLRRNDVAGTWLAS
jgi:hypothetical protein